MWIGCSDWNIVFATTRMQYRQKEISGRIWDMVMLFDCDLKLLRHQRMQSDIGLKQADFRSVQNHSKVLTSSAVWDIYSFLQRDLYTYIRSSRCDETMRVLVCRCTCVQRNQLLLGKMVGTKRWGVTDASRIGDYMCVITTIGERERECVLTEGFRHAITGEKPYLGGRSENRSQKTLRMVRYVMRAKFSWLVSMAWQSRPINP